MRRFTLTICVISVLACVGCGEDGDGETADTGVEADTSDQNETDTETRVDIGEDTAPAPDSSGEDAGGPRFETVDCSNVTAATTVQVGPGFQYVPETAEVDAGETVKWEWADNLQVEHDVVGGGTCGDPKPDWFESTRSKSSSKTFCVTFLRPGDVEYQCTVTGHCMGGMKGTIAVK